MTQPPRKAAAPPKTGLIGAFAEFWRGFVTPSLFAFGLTMTIFIIGAVLVVTMITPAFLAGPAGSYLPRSTRDSEAFVTREALRLAQPIPASDTRQRIYILGDSATAHAFASVKGVEDAIGAATGKPVVAGFLTTPLQRSLDEARLADYATRGRAGTVVFGVSFDHYGLTPEYLLQLDRLERLGLRSPWASRDILQLGGRPRRLFGNYMIDNRGFLLRDLRAMIGRMVLRKSATRRIDVYTRVPPATPAYIAAERVSELRTLRAFSPSTDVSVTLLGDTVGRLKARGNRILFVEIPVDDAMFETPEDIQRYTDYLAWSKALASRLGGDYCRLADYDKPPPSAYADLVHIVDPAIQAQLRQALAKCVAAMGISGKTA